MATNYRERIIINHNGGTIGLYTKSGEQIANGYTRIVFGDRGPYIEFTREQMINSAMYIPKDMAWKMKPEHTSKVYYFELRTNVDDVKVYFQRKTVDYADYKVNYFYISPFDLYDGDGVVLIEPLKKKAVNPKPVEEPKPKRERITKSKREECYRILHESLIERFKERDKVNKDLVKFYSGKKSIFGHKIKEKDKVLNAIVIFTDNLECEDSYVSVSVKRILMSELDKVCKKYYLVNNDRDEPVIVELEYMFMEILKKKILQEY